MANNCKKRVEANSPKYVTIQIAMFKCDNVLESYNCKYCFFVTGLKATLKEHTWRCHISFHNYSKTNIGMDNYKCQNCSFTSYSILVYYLHKSHCTLPEENKTFLVKSLDNQGSGYKCYWCSFKAKTKSDLKIHETLQHRNGPCSLCDCKSRGSKGLRRPCRSRHSGEIYKCIQCQYKTISKKLIKKHIYARHLSTRTKKISIETLYKNNLIDIVCGKNVWYKCDQCTFKTKIKDRLRLHVATKHSNGSCGFCEYKSKGRGDLRRHRLDQHPEELYRCTLCPYKTININYMKSHFCAKHFTQKELQQFTSKNAVNGFFKWDKPIYETTKEGGVNVSQRKRPNSSFTLKPTVNRLFKCSKSVYKITKDGIANVTKNEPPKLAVKESFKSNKSIYKITKEGIVNVTQNGSPSNNSFTRKAAVKELFKCNESIYKVTKESIVNVTQNEPPNSSFTLKPALNVLVKCKKPIYETTKEGIVNAAQSGPPNSSFTPNPADNGLFKCNKCIYKTKKECNLTLHLNLAHKSCFCGYESRYNIELNNHYLMCHPEKVYTCRRCSYRTLDDIMRDNSAPPSVKYKCPRCQKTVMTYKCI